MKVILFNTSNGSAFEMQFTNARQMKNYIKLGSGFVSTAVACKMRQKAIYHTCTAEGKDTVQAV